jgi:hypothetical protein
VLAWPPTLAGKLLRCPRCRTVFAHVQALESLPVASAVEDEQEPTRMKERPLSPAVCDRLDDPADSSFDTARKTTYALLMRTLDADRRSGAALVAALLLSPPAIPFLCGLGFGAMGLAWLVCNALSVLFGPRTNALLYVVPLLFVAFGWRLMRNRGDREIRLRLDRQGRADGLRLGRLGAALQATPVLSGLAFVCLLFGMQIGLLFYAANHAGLAIEGSFGECLDLSLNNLTHVYDLTLGGKVKHTYLSAAVFLGFRAGYLLTGVFLYDLYKRWKIYRLIGTAPTREPSVSGLTEWIARQCGDKRGWPRFFFDEFLFLLLAGEYLRGHFEMVEYLSECFTRLEVGPEVRRLFVGPDGGVLFHGQPA